MANLGTFAFAFTFIIITVTIMLITINMVQVEIDFKAMFLRSIIEESKSSGFRHTRKSVWVGEDGFISENVLAKSLFSKSLE